MNGFEKFALSVLEETRNSLADLDGGWLQDKAEELGLMVRVEVSEPCALRRENCRCYEYGGDFPQGCLRYSELEGVKRWNRNRAKLFC